MKRYVFLILFFVSLSLNANESRFFLEFDQMLSLKAGIKIPLIDDDLYSRATLGIGVFGIGTFTYNAMLGYRVLNAESYFDINIEAGLLLAYANLLEGAVVDWDTHIDDPFAGWLTGGALLFRWQTWPQQYFGVRCGYSYWIEWQRDSGWKNGAIIIVSLVYDF